VLDRNALRCTARAGGERLAEVALAGAGATSCGPLVVEVGADGDAATWSVANASDATIALDAVGLAWTEPVTRVPVAVFLNGYQSWSPSGVRTLGVDEDPSRHPDTFPLLRSAHHADPGVCAPGELRSEQVAVLDRGAGDLVAVGFLGGARHEGTVRLRPAGDRSVAVEAQAWLGGAQLAPGERLELHPVVRRLGDDAASLLAAWAADAGRAEGARTASPYQVGWCSWYHYFHAVTEADVHHNLGRASDWPFEVFQLDDGYQAAIGDWLATNDRFPHGIEGVAAAVVSAGLVPGLWLAPFLAAPGSEVARRHPDWFARDAAGEPLMSMFHPDWGGAMWQLDVTRPEVLAHLRDTAAALRATGFRYLKLDFTFCSTAPGVYADPSRTPAQRVRDGYAAVRAGLGDDGFLLGCGCPLGAVVGIVDAMRIGPDVAPSWDVDAASPGFPGYEGAAPSTRGAWSATLARSFLHRRLWANDPDCLMLRTTHTDLAPAAARAWALAVGASGGLALVSDDLALLDAGARDLLDDVVAIGRAADAAARVGSPPRCEDLMRAGGPTRLASAGRTLSVPDLDHPDATLT
jgi:alpha-galactosidase